MNRWHFYRLDTGVFLRGSFVASDEALATANTPPGCGAYRGEVDPDSQRIDLMTGEVVEWRPAPPSDEHEWNDEKRRWVLNADAAQRAAERLDALRRITALEAKQLRPLRELLIDVDNIVARTELAAIEREISALRPKVQRAANNNKAR